ncbi:sulfite exporter TauE/SafE family protein [Aliiglaciecola litoralis]|uniref:Probable membrane transporter protein n=1 Tax=Aliiglaciecola litoralis TaxID=582857 RepID=A0ABP3WUW2_9ALTE
MLEIFSYALSYQQLALLFLCAFFIGMAKTGVHGVVMFSVPIMAIIFGGKASSGLVLPMLIMADVFAVFYYHRHANWGFLIKLFPSAAIGVLIATVIGNNINDEMFKQIMAVVIILSLAIMIWLETGNKQKIPDYLWFAILMGTLGGITTMIGNLAGSVMALYLLSMRLPKNEFIGTAAWFFLSINLFKVPFHIWSWETISLDSFYLNLLSLPFIAVGAYLGVQIVKRISDKSYRWLILTMTAVAAIFMMI